MADKTTSSPVIMATTAHAGTPKKAAKPVKPRDKPTRPKTSEMVNAAIAALKERGGSSAQAIKKYIAGTYKLDAEKQATFIKKYLKAAVISGALIQTKGKGAAGSFKLAATKLEKAKPKTKVAAKAAVLKKAAPAKKTSGLVKTTATKKPSATAAKKTSGKKIGTATAEKKASKGPAAKPPKAKTTKVQPAARAPAKKSKPTTPKKTKPAAARPKKAAPKKAAVSKK